MKTKLQEEKYYTFIELTTALRKEYKETQELLKRLKKCIKIDTKYESDFDLSLILITGVDNEDDTSKVKLIVTKKTTTPAIAIRKFMNNYNLNNTRESKDEAIFILDEYNDFEFEQINKLDIEKAFTPNVLIEDKNEFINIYNELKQKKLFNLKELYVKINPKQILCVDGDGIYLYNGDDKQEINIKYDAKSDSIKIDSNTKYNTVFIENLLDTVISKDKFTLEYIDFLENTDEKEKYSFIDDTINKKRETLDFINKNKSLVLIKRNYK